MRNGYLVLLAVALSSSALAADFGVSAGLGVGYVNWNGWGGFSYGASVGAGFKLLRVHTVAEGLYWPVSVAKNGQQMKFTLLGGLVKPDLVGCLYAGLGGGVGLGYGYIPSFTDEQNRRYGGTGSVLIAVGFELPMHLSSQVGLSLAFENVFAPALSSFYNPSAKLAIAYEFPKRGPRHRPAPKPKPAPEPKPQQVAEQPKPAPKEEAKPPAPVVVTPKPAEQPGPATGGEVKPAEPARFPPRLEAVPSFAELGKKNSALDAGEQAYIVVAVTNKGKGEAKDLRVKAEAISSMSGIEVGPEQRIARLATGASESVRIGLKAAEDLKDQEVRFRISVVEPTFGADALPAVVTITAKGFEPPLLALYDKAITDDPKKSDYTDGNGNGQWEASEQVEVTFAIQNKGTGPAEGAQLDVAVTDPNVMLMGGKSTFSLGDVAAGDYRMVKCPVYVNPRFQGSSVRLVLNIRDQRPKLAWADTVAIPLNQQVKEASEVVVAPKTTGAGPAAVQPPSLTDSLLVGIPKGASNPDAFAVVIGVANYRDVRRVEYARQDAEAMRRYLVDAFGYQEGNVVFLPDPSKADLERTFGTMGNPEGQLYNWTSRKPNQSDVFVFYVGHGAPSIKEKKGYLVPADASPDYIEINGYPLDVFYANLGKVPARSLTVVLDACFSGETPDIAGKVTTFLRDASPLVVAPVTEELPANAAVMTAASGSQIASWYPEKKHSLFTYYLLKGLQGGADTDNNGSITLGELRTFVSDRVPPMARALYGREQTPEVMGKLDAEMLRLK